MYAPAKAMDVTPSTTAGYCPDCCATMMRVVMGERSQYWCFRCHPVAVVNGPIEEDGEQ